MTRYLEWKIRSSRPHLWTSPCDNGLFLSYILCIYRSSYIYTHKHLCDPRLYFYNTRDDTCSTIRPKIDGGIENIWGLSEIWWQMTQLKKNKRSLLLFLLLYINCRFSLLKNYWLNWISKFMFFIYLFIFSAIEYTLA